MHQTFITTTRGLKRDTPPMRLFEKAKRFGIWNPSEIDLTQDIADWQRMTNQEKDLILRLTAMFQAGEEAVTLDLLPLIMVIAREGRLEEEMFLTTFLWEEAKHTDFFHRIIDEVFQIHDDLSQFHSASYHQVFYEALPEALDALSNDSSPQAQIKASATYNMIVEGVLAETGYHGYFTALEKNDLLPGVREGIRLLKQDESRHIAYGVFLLSRLIAENDGLWDHLETTMNDLLMPAVGVINEIFEPYGDDVPFGLVPDDFVEYGMSQFQKRMDRIERARGATLEDIYRVTTTIIEKEDS